MKITPTISRMRHWPVILVAAGVLAGGYWGLAANGRSDADGRAPVEVKVDREPIQFDAENALSFSPIVKKVTPSVVKVVTREYAKAVPGNRGSLSSPEDIFRYFFGPGTPDGRMPGPQMRPQPEPQPQLRPQMGIGSGVIVSADGYILTNNHVVEGADEVIVTLADGRELDAKVIGTDPKSDIAVIKVNGTDLPAITFGDSDIVEVGDRVLAVGNPFGFGQTVTSGIVSATGRSLSVDRYEDYIQTDAAINRGNSGGALVDMGGRLIGLNTLIFSQSGGFQGIGFAIPSSMAQSVMNSLVEFGKVTRGFLGIVIQTLSPDLTQAFNLPEDTKGVLVAEIAPDGPSANSELQTEDVIIEFNGREVTDARELRFAVADTKPGTEVPARVLRDGRETEITMTVGTLEDETTVAAGPGMADDEGVLNGVGVADLTPQARQQLNVPESVAGAVITQVDPTSPSARAGLQPGDVIQEINRTPVTSADDAIRLTKEFGDGKTLLRVWSRGGSRFVVVDESNGRPS